MDLKKTVNTIPVVDALEVLLYYVGIPILYLVPYLIVFFGLQQYSYFHSNRLMQFWKDSKSASTYVKGGTHIHAAFVIGTASAS